MKMRVKDFVDRVYVGPVASPAQRARKWFLDRPKAERVVCERCGRKMPPCHFPCGGEEAA